MKTVTARSAGGVALDGENRVALTSRRTFSGPLKWGLPKGIIEEGETPEVAALRETTEETGFEVEMIGPLRAIDYWFVPPASDKEESVRVHKFVHFFLMRITGGDPETHDFETETVECLPLAEAAKRASYASEKTVILEAIEKVDQT